MDIFKKYNNSEPCGCTHGSDNIFYGGFESGELSVFYTGATGTEDYEKLINKPKINGIELLKDVSLDDLGIASKDELAEIVFDFEDIPAHELDAIMFGI